MSDEVLENSARPDQHTGPATEPPNRDQSPSEARLVPVGESIKYRRRAQQAEGRLQEIEQQLGEFQAQLDSRSEELATAEAQRDEVSTRLEELENRRDAEHILYREGVADIEDALLILSNRVDFKEHNDAETLSRSVRQLLLDKPHLRGPSRDFSGSLPPATAAAARPPRSDPSAQLALAAERASTTGNRRDVSQYLRLRRATLSQ